MYIQIDSFFIIFCVTCVDAKGDYYHFFNKKTAIYVCGLYELWALNSDNLLLIMNN